MKRAAAHIQDAPAYAGPAPPAASGDAPDSPVLSSGISRRLWRLYAGFWLICLLFPLLALAQRPPPQLLLALAGLAIFVVSYLWVLWPHPVRPSLRLQPAQAALVCGLLTALILALSLAYGASFLWLFVGLSAMVGVALPARPAFVAVMGTTLLTLGVGIALSGGVTQADWLHLLPLVLLVRGLGLDMAGLARLAQALNELHATRRELARLAVVEERLRLARDLHDLLGHTLSMITLKSELAGRLVVSEPGRAAEEMREVERVARQTLREVREAVAGYRQPTLQSELDGARELLEAAGIAGTVEDDALALPPGTDAVLGWVVREGATNVIRHSRARRCAIRIWQADGLIHAEVRDDGEGWARPGAAGVLTQAGSGLVGLAERVRALGGALEAGPLQDASGAGFRLHVMLPHGGAAGRGAGQ
jgi:two-component system sensor histidine kinase DesK